MSASARTSRMEAAPPPNILYQPPDMFTVTFKLRDCEFMEFQESLDRNEATVYDLMYAISKHHGETISPDKVQIYVKVTDDEYRPITDLTKKLSELEGIDIYYYDFDPINGSLLIIPS